MFFATLGWPQRYDLLVTPTVAVMPEQRVRKKSV
jgi:hypothetical protein